MELRKDNLVSSLKIVKVSEEALDDLIGCILNSDSLFKENGPPQTH